MRILCSFSQPLVQSQNARPVCERRSFGPHALLKPNINKTTTAYEVDHRIAVQPSSCIQQSPGPNFSPSPESQASILVLLLEPRHDRRYSQCQYRCIPKYTTSCGEYQRKVSVLCSRKESYGTEVLADHERAVVILLAN